VEPTGRGFSPRLHVAMHQVVASQLLQSADEIAEEFNLAPVDVRWALAYETSARAA
jgi:hypothetical protein